ncbi:MAG: flagellar hook-associated protein FlgK [Lachnospiraceae bacterium]|nr:flagellar hook-associated protein FlgK [Lachnospiraceae bacterium]
MASQNALNVSSNNLANVDTKGYTRQQVVFGNSILNTIDKSKAIGYTQIGLGVNVDEVRQVRNFFMDESYRRESGRHGFYSATFEAIEEMYELFGEMEGVELRESMSDLWDALSEVAKSPNDATQLALLKDKANSFVTRCEAVSTGLKDYQQNVNKKIEESVDRINELAENIYNLNLDICKIEAGGIENAHALRDLRNMALDELGTLINISYKENEAGMVTVRAEGQDFITRSNYYKMEATRDNKTELVTPTWPHLNGKEVFTFEQQISTSLNTDIGKLKAYVIARGDVEANYQDIPVRPDMPDEKDFANPADYQAAMEEYQAVSAIYDRFTSGENFVAPKLSDYNGNQNLYNAAVKAYDALVHYGTYTSASVINKVQAEFDQLFHSVVTMFNDILCPNKEVTLADGKKIMILDEENCSYGADGQVGVELFSRNGYPRYTKQVMSIRDENGNVSDKEVYVYNEEMVNGDDKGYYVYNGQIIETNGESIVARKGTQYTLGNVSVNPEVMKDATSLPMTTKQGEADYKRAEALLDKWAEPFARLNPFSAAKADFQTYYKQMVGDLANLGSIYAKVADDLNDSVSYIDNKRQEVAGVSSDEELSNIIRFQNAYNASSRYITVINEMLGHLISQLGTV